MFFPVKFESVVLVRYPAHLCFICTFDQLSSLSQSQIQIKVGAETESYSTPPNLYCFTYLLITAGASLQSVSTPYTHALMSDCMKFSTDI